MLLRVVRAKIIWMGGSFLVSAGNYGHSTKLLDPHRRDRRQLIYIYVAGKSMIIIGCWTRFHNVSLDRNYAQGLSLGMEERAMIMAGPETRPLMARCVHVGVQNPTWTIITWQLLVQRNASRKSLVVLFSYQLAAPNQQSSIMGIITSSSGYNSMAFFCQVNISIWEAICSYI